MGVVSVGNVGVTAQFLAYGSQSDVVLDGEISPVERGRFVSALESYATQLETTARSEGRTLSDDETELVQRLRLYARTLRSGCGDTTAAIPIMQGLYEDLTQLIESSAWNSVPSDTQTQFVGLLTETYQWLYNARQHRSDPAGVSGSQPRSHFGSGTEAETPQPQFVNPTSEAFHVNPDVLQRVEMAAESLGLDRESRRETEGVCAVPPIESQIRGVYPTLPPSAQPLTFGVSPETWDAYRLNLDFRYAPSRVPAVVVDTGEAGQEEAEPAGRAVGGSTDPFGDIDFGG